MLLVLSNKKAVVCKYPNIILSYDYRNAMLLYFVIDDIPCRDCGIFVDAYTEYLSDGLQVPSCGISADTLSLRYTSLL